MKKLAVFLLTGLTCASMLFGCGSKNDTVETVPVAEVQESTAAPAETESETETETVEEDVPPEEGMVKSDLTGEWISGDLADQRPIAVMIPDENAALPHYGLSNADILYECSVEGNMTRLIKLKNASLLPASCVAVTVGWRDLLDNSTGTVESMGMAGGKRTGVLEFCIPVKYSGVYEFWIQSASVRDWLRLWSKKLLITDKKVQVLSVPLVHQAEEWIPPAQLASGGDSDQHSQKKGGDDGSEVFEVRAYRDGDPLQRVHWKLTAKTGEMLVREFSLPKREVLLLQVDLYHPPQEKWDHCKLERLLEQTADFCWRLLAAEQEYEVFWQEQEQLCRMQISRVQELWVFLKRLCLTATKEELEQNGKQSQKQSAGKNKYPAEDLLEKGRGSGVTEPVVGGQLWKIDAEGTVRQVRGNEERAGAGTAG